MIPMIALILAANSLTVLEAYQSARAHQRDGYRVPEPARLERVTRLFTQLAPAVASGPPPANLVALAHQSGFELVGGTDKAGAVWILRELPTQREGAGFYLLRPQGMPVCLQAPHTFFDEGTGDVALALFAELRASCLCTNTVHRRVVDVAHAEPSVFLAATQGLLQGAHWPVVQLHGFAADSQARGVQAVVSEGTRSPTLASKLQQALAGTAGKVLLFPRDTQALGGTANVEGAAARAAGIPFLHIEMSAGFRKRLIGDPSPLASALRQVLATP